MIELLPEVYHKSQVVRDIYRTINILLIDGDEYFNDCSMNIFVETAENLDRFEIETGVEKSNDFEFEKSNILLRLQGGLTLNLDAFKSIISSFDVGDFTVQQDYQNYAVKIIFNEVKGIPNNYEKLKSEVEKVMPAHLKLDFQFLYNSFYSAVYEILRSDEEDDISWFTWDNIEEYAYGVDTFDKLAVYNR